MKYAVRRGNDRQMITPSPSTWAGIERETLFATPSFSLLQCMAFPFILCCSGNSKELREAWFESKGSDLANRTSYKRPRSQGELPKMILEISGGIEMVLRGEKIKYHK